MGIALTSCKVYLGCSGFEHETEENIRIIETESYMRENLYQGTLNVSSTVCCWILKHKHYKVYTS